LKNLELEDLAHLVCTGLKDSGIVVTLSGGACVSIYTQNAYQSYDLDFIRDILTSFAEVSEVMDKLGFRREGRHFIHPRSKFYVEFPAPPLTVGKESPREIVDHRIGRSRSSKSIRMLSPTDCVKDRLCQFFYWRDLQSLDQAILVSISQKVDLKELARWSKHEGMTDKFKEFYKALLTKKKRPKKSGPPKNGS
jgi:hypothetical protein